MGNYLGWFGLLKCLQVVALIVNWGEKMIMAESRRHHVMAWGLNSLRMKNVGWVCAAWQPGKMPLLSVCSWLWMWIGQLLAFLLMLPKLGTATWDYNLNKAFLPSVAAYQIFPHSHRNETRTGQLAAPLPSSAKGPDCHRRRVLICRFTFESSSAPLSLTTL